MPVKKFKPTSPGRRQMETLVGTEITTDQPYKPLVTGKGKKGGRGSSGRISVRHKGGGHKRRLREIDFRRDKMEVPGRVATIEYDPNRSANIALVHYVDGDKRYVLAPVGLRVGSTIVASDAADIEVGNCMSLARMPLGTTIHNIEMRPGKGGQMVRAAGASAQLLAKEGKYAQVRLPSGEVRRVLQTCRATVGQVGNVDHGNVSVGKAGRTRWKGVRPTVRGVAMNPIDHPHGGGEGRTSGGRHPVSPWGVPTKGHKTRHNPRTDKFIVRRRRKRK